MFLKSLMTYSAGLTFDGNLKPFSAKYSGMLSMGPKYAVLRVKGICELVRVRLQQLAGAKSIEPNLPCRLL